MDSASTRQEMARLEALRSLNIYGSERRPEFDAIVHSIASIFDAPIALVSLIEEDSQWFKAKCGLDPDGTSREVSFCAHAIRSRDVFIIPDASLDVRFRDNPLVTGDPFIRFYAGVPISIDGIFFLGALCVIDHKPRQPTPEQIEQLKRFGTIVEGLIRAHKQEQQVRSATEVAQIALQDAERKSMLLEEVTKASGVGGWEVDLTSQKVSFTARAREILEMEADTLPHVDDFLSFFPDGAQGEVGSAIDMAIKESLAWDIEVPLITCKQRQTWVRCAGHLISSNQRRVRLVGSISDISLRKASEAAMAKSEATQRTILSSLTEGILLISSDGLILSHNPAALEILGQPDSPITGSALADLALDFLPSAEYPIVDGNQLVAAAAAGHFETTLRIRCPDTHATKLVQLRASPVDQRSGLALFGTVLSFSDVTEQRRNAETLKVLFESLPVGLGYWDENLDLASYNDGFLDALEIPNAEAEAGINLYDHILGNARCGVYGPGDPQTLAEIQFNRVNNGNGCHFERPRLDGRVHEVRGKPVPGGGILFSFFEITERKEQERQLIEKEQLARMRSQELEAILAGMRQGVSVFDAEGRLQLWNAKYLTIFNKSEEDVWVGLSFLDLLKTEKDRGEFEGDPVDHYEALKAGLAAGEAIRHTFIHPNGRIISAVHAPLPSGGWIGTHEDVTQSEKAREAIAYAAHHDSLTALANRMLFNIRLDEAIQRMGDEGKESYLILIDLDHFKPINDTHGHDAGDAVLKVIARRLEESVRSSDLVARLGGDEFAMILTNQPADPQGLKLIIERIFNNIRKPISYQDIVLRVGVSMGIAPITQRCQSANELLKQADKALYAVKNNDRNGFKFYGDLESSEVRPKAGSYQPV